MKILLFVPVAIGLFGPPNWVNKKPLSETHYIGISVVSKKEYRDNYKQVALERALSFLSSEISVFVKSKTESIQKDINDNIDNSFVAKTNTLTKDKLEGYKVVDTWENRKTYAIYLHLSKAEYLESKRKLFIGSLKVLQEKYTKYQKTVDKRIFDKALSLANSMERESIKLLSKRNVIPYLTTFEFQDLTKYSDLKIDLIGDLKVLAKSEDILPFTWVSGDNLKLSLVDANNKPWKNWNGVLYNIGGKEVADILKQEDYTISFPKPIYIASFDDLKFNLEINVKKGKRKVSQKKIAFSVPITYGVKKGTIILKKIPKDFLKRIEETVEQLLVNFKQEDSKEAKKTTEIDVEVEYVPSFETAGFKSGILSMTFKNNYSQTNRNLGVGILEVKCSGNDFERMLTNAIKSIRLNLSKNKIIWK